MVRESPPSSPSPQKARSPRNQEGGEHGGKHYNKSAAVWRECKIAGTDLVVYNTREGWGGKGCKLEWRGGGARLKAMAHCECYLSCCLRIYGVRYPRSYWPIIDGYSHRLWPSAICKGAEGENLSSSSPLPVFPFLFEDSLDTRWTEGRGGGRRCYYLSATDATTSNIFPSFFSWGE